MIQRYSISVEPGNLTELFVGTKRDDAGEWVRWGDVEDLARSCNLELLKHERQKYALELSYGVHDKKNWRTDEQINRVGTT